MSNRIDKKAGSSNSTRLKSYASSLAGHPRTRGNCERRTNMHISRLEPVPLRELWRNEARDFTAWLAENLDFLGETLSVDLSLVEQEASAGAFAVDILAEDGNGNPVIIENQLERTNHDHLGKLITYMSNLDAKVAVWITSGPRPEHEKAVHWLNEALPADTAFYLIRIEAYRIGNSPPAPLLTIVAGPSPEAKQIGDQKKELAQRHLLRLEFWGQLLERAKERTSLHARKSPTKENWIGTGTGRRGLSLNYVIRMESTRVELYIDTGEAEANKSIFDQLVSNKDPIEDAFGAPLDWQRLDDRRACRICHHLAVGGLADRDRWPEIQDAMIDAMVSLEQALKPHIKRLRV